MKYNNIVIYMADVGCASLFKRLSYVSKPDCHSLDGRRWITRRFASRRVLKNYWNCTVGRQVDNALQLKVRLRYDAEPETGKRTQKKICRHGNNMLR